MKDSYQRKLARFHVGFLVLLQRVISLLNIILLGGVLDSSSQTREQEGRTGNQRHMVLVHAAEGSHWCARSGVLSCVTHTKVLE